MLDHQYGSAEIAENPGRGGTSQVPIVRSFAVSNEYIVVLDSYRNEVKVYARDGTFQASRRIDALLPGPRRVLAVDIAVRGESLFLLEDRYLGVRLSPELDARFVVYEHDMDSGATNVIEIRNAILGTAAPTEYRGRAPGVGGVGLYVFADAVTLYDQANGITCLANSVEGVGEQNTTLTGRLTPAGLVVRGEDKSVQLERSGLVTSIGEGSVQAVSPDGRFLLVASYPNARLVDIDGRDYGAMRVPVRDRGNFAPVHESLRISSDGIVGQVLECYVSKEGVFVVAWELPGAVK